MSPLDSSRPLFVTADEVLLDDLLRLAAAAGVTPDVATEPAAARRSWSAASLVLVGEELVDAVTAASAARRADVAVVTREPPEASIWQRAMRMGAETVVVLPDAEDDVREWLADVADGGAVEAVTLCVVGGCGGAGASTLASALALVAARRGLRAQLLDGDPLGGGIDLVVGAESSPGLRWPDLLGARGRLNASSLRASLPAVEGLAVLSWDRGKPLPVLADTMRAVLSAGQRCNDLLVVDVPRHGDQASVQALAGSTSTLLVVPAEVRAIASARRVVAQLFDSAPDLRLVVRGPGQSGLDGQLVADTLRLPLAAQLRPENGLAEAIEHGFGPCRRSNGPLVATCEELLGRYGLLSRKAA